MSPDDKARVDALREEIVTQVREWIAEGMIEERGDALIESAARGDTSLTVADLSVIAREWLAWDLPSFLGGLGLGDDEDMYEVSDADKVELYRLNGGVFDIGEHKWDT